MEGQTIPVYDAVCLRSIRRVTEIFSGKWSFLVLEQLHIGTMRFSELSRRHLEVNGIIQRTVRPTVPVTVEYSLTDKGRSFDKVLLAMKEWENANESGMIEKRSGSR